MCEADKNCDHRTADQRDMDRHYWSHHKKFAEKYGIHNPKEDCPTCGMEFTRSDNMTRHQNNHKCRPRERRA